MIWEKKGRNRWPRQENGQGKWKRKAEHGGEKSGNDGGERGKKCNVIWKTILCFSVCSIFLLNAASFVNVAGERRSSGRWSKRGTIAQALILYTHYPPENANSVFKESTWWSVTQFQVSINVYTCMYLTEVNGSSFSPCSPCLCFCLLSISVFPLQRLQDVSFIAL